MLLPNELDTGGAQNAPPNAALSGRRASNANPTVRCSAFDDTGVVARAEDSLRRRRRPRPMLQSQAGTNSITRMIAGAVPLFSTTSSIPL